VFIVAAKRTPFGSYGGLLKDFSATDLAEFAARAALAAGKVPPETIDSVVVGNVMQVTNDAGYFNEEMAPIEVKTRKGKQMMQVDEHARPQTTLEQLQKLPPVFKKDGTVTAGNASGVSDGAGAVIIASEDAVKKHNFTPLARVVSYFVSGCDPSIMGIGPVPAINGALKRAGLSLKDMDLVDVNEAFAPQYLAVQKALDLDPSKSNVNGGAIALGHPLAGSGSRITAH
ncbi:hypothetical protein A6R68_11322, partial [Neotoma lepida]